MDAAHKAQALLRIVYCILKSLPVTSPLDAVVAKELEERLIGHLTSFPLMVASQALCCTVATLQALSCADCASALPRPCAALSLQLLEEVVQCFAASIRKSGNHELVFEIYRHFYRTLPAWRSPGACADPRARRTASSPWAPAHLVRPFQQNSRGRFWRTPTPYACLTSSEPLSCAVCCATTFPASLRRSNTAVGGGCASACT